MVIVRDVFQPSAPEVSIAVDPKLDVKANAEALFRRARKLERAAVALAGRMAEVDGRRVRAGGFLQRLGGARSTRDLEAIERELNASSLLRVVRRPQRREPGRKPSFMRLREYTTSDGFVVVVGRSGADNDTLTFKIAAPHDFWLHAAGRPGAHVVVRNPRKAKELPERTLQEAAGIAAWYSRGDKQTEVEVHYTRRKEVRKGPGMSPGMVILKSHRSIKVRPGLPRSPAPGAGRGRAADRGRAGGGTDSSSH